MVPADDQAMVLPCASVMVIMVLLNVELTCATPETMFLRSRRRTRPASLAIVWSFRRVRHAGRWGAMIPGSQKAAGTVLSSAHPGHAKHDPGSQAEQVTCPDPGSPCRAVRDDARARLTACPGRHFFLPAIGFALPLRVRALVWVRWPRTG